MCPGPRNSSFSCKSLLYTCSADLTIPSVYRPLFGIPVTVISIISACSIPRFLSILILPSLLPLNFLRQATRRLGAHCLLQCDLYDPVLSSVPLLLLLQCAKLLLKRGASISLRDHTGNTPFDIAMARGKVADEELFLLLSGATTGR